MISQFWGMLFGGGRNVVAETVEVFRENAEAGAVRSAQIQTGAMGQFSAEFGQRQRGWFDRFMDGLNRLPRPAMVIGILALFASAMTNPIWFAERMQGLALVPEPLWWLLGAVVSFYFGARQQVKAQDFQRDLAETMSRVPQVVENIDALRSLRHDSPGAADTGTDTSLAQSATEQSENPAVTEWQEGKEWP
ncbi:MAG: holin family protein [Pseudophaeobacter sp.]|uniref:holin family protein n=1 Tax=Pseudophaeobacter sp. TaxID=1971739 RepID=UPI003263C163